MDNPPLNSFRKNSIINQKIPSNKALQKRIHELFLKKYSKLPFSYNKNIIEKSKIDVLSKLMSVSMILFQSEDSWEIKYLGINLLYKLIKLFSNIKDSRTDDDSLLIQQYDYAHKI